MTRVIRIPARIARPISWSGKPGFFGTKYMAKFTDGVWRRVSRQDIEDNADD